MHILYSYYIAIQMKKNINTKTYTVYILAQAFEAHLTRVIGIHRAGSGSSDSLSQSGSTTLEMGRLMAERR